jgi:hypothetical protein
MHNLKGKQLGNWLERGVAPFDTKPLHQTLGYDFCSNYVDALPKSQSGVCTS